MEPFTYDEEIVLVLDKVRLVTRWWGMGKNIKQKASKLISKRKCLSEILKGERKVSVWKHFPKKTF